MNLLLQQILNPVDVCCNISTPNLLCMSNLTHAEGVDRGIVKKVPDFKFYMPIGFRNVPAEMFYRPNKYDVFLGKTLTFNTPIIYTVQKLDIIFFRYQTNILSS